VRHEYRYLHAGVCIGHGHSASIGITWRMSLPALGHLATLAHVATASSLIKIGPATRWHELHGPSAHVRT